MKAMFASRKHALRLGKSLRDYFHGVPLATCQEWAAKILGYRDLHELTAVAPAAAERQASSWAYDEDAPPEDVRQRRAFQAKKLAALAKIDETDASIIISALAPTAKKRPEDQVVLTSRPFLKVGEYMREGDVNDGLRQAIVALKTGQKATLLGKVSTMLVIERAFKEPHDAKLLREVMELGSDAGWAECSYNLALDLASGWGDFQSEDSERKPPRDEIARVDTLYAKVIASKTNESGSDGLADLRSAAMVNRAAIRRDGLLTGERDWPGAVQLYEEAAALGNVVGAFNAGNVSDWLARRGDAGYAGRSALWFRRAIEMIGAGPIKQSHTSKANADDMVESAKRGIAHLVMDGLIDAQGDEVIARIAAEHEMICSRGGHGQRVKRFTDRVKVATEAAAPTPAGNWLRVLTMMGWKCPTRRIERDVFQDPVTPGRTLRLEAVNFPRKGREASVRLVVVWDACLPFDDGFTRIEAAVEHVRRSDRDSYLVAVGRKALIKVEGAFEFTPAWMARPGESKAQMVSIAGRSAGPMDLAEQIEKGRTFASSIEDASLNYEFAIAVNTLDAGVPAAEHWDARTVRWVGVGGAELTEWRMPYHDNLELIALRIAADWEETKGD